MILTLSSLSIYIVINMTKLVAHGEYVLLEEIKQESKKVGGGMLLAEGLSGNKKYKVLSVGIDVYTDIKEGDTVYVDDLSLGSISTDGINKFFFIHKDKILGYLE